MPYYYSALFALSVTAWLAEPYSAGLDLMAWPSAVLYVPALASPWEACRGGSCYNCLAMGRVF